MSCDFHTVTIERFKHYDVCLLGYGAAVKSKADGNLSVFFLCRKGDLGDRFLAVYEERLARCLVHKDAFNGVFLTDRKVLVGNGVLNDNVALGSSGFFSVHGCLCSDFRNGNLDGLILVLNVCVYGKLFAVLIQSFKYHKACVFLDES